MKNHDDLRVLTLGAASASSGAAHLLGSLSSGDLNVNMLRFTGDEGIERHVNREVDVLIVALDGSGIVEVEDTRFDLTAGQAVVIPKGTERAIRSAGDRFAYLTCHGQRRGMMPAVPGR